jgi:hypothetical protein
MEFKPFEIKVEAVVIRANGTREDLGVIGSTALKEENEHGTVI